MTQPIPPALDLEAIRARVEAATPGPWTWDGNDAFAAIIPPEGYDLVLSHYDDDVGIGLSDDDGEFIAHARTDVPALLAEVKRLHAGEPWETVELRVEIKRLREHVTILEGAVDGSRISCRQWEKLAADHMLRYEARETYVTQVEQDLADARAEVERLRSGQPWEELFHQRDEAIAERDRYAEVVAAAQAWREMRRATPAKPKPAAAALIAAVDRLGGDDHG